MPLTLPPTVFAQVAMRFLPGLWLHACGIGAMIGQITSMCPAAILVVTVQMACLVAVWLMALLAAWLLALLMWWKLGQC